MDGTQVLLETVEALALDAESRITDSPTQTEREYWQRMANHWWDALAAVEVPA